MAKKVIVVGGGVAGLAASAALIGGGFEVLLFESRSFLGGRIYSFIEPSSKDTVDNGQHLFAGFYCETMKFLSMIGTSKHLAVQKRLQIDFIEKGGKISRFSAPWLPSPLHFLAGLFKYSKFPKKDFFRLIVNGRKVKKDPGIISAAELLEDMGQSEEAQDAFYRPLALATLNADLHEVSGRLFQLMLRTILTVSSKQAVLAYATVGFSELIAEPAAEYIKNAGGEIRYSNQIAKVFIENGKVTGVEDFFGVRHEADHYILALPPDALSAILPTGTINGLDKWGYSPIVSVNLWYDRRISEHLMLGLLGTHFHWYFDKTRLIKDGGTHRYVTLLASSAYDMISMTKEEIVSRALEDMAAIFPESKSATVMHTQVIRERKATVLISAGAILLRQKTKTAIGNLYLAGDWIDTGLPATVESGVKSGFMAADAIYKG